MSYEVSTILLLLIVAGATWTDIASHRVPNVLTLGAVAAGLSMHSLILGSEGLIIGLQGLGVGLLMFLPFYALGGMGAGDVKLMAGVSTFLGASGAMLAVILSLFAGSVLGATVLLVRRGALQALRRYGAMLRFVVCTGKFSYLPPQPEEPAAVRFPYALAVAVGTVGTLAWLGRLDWLLGS